MFTREELLQQLREIAKYRLNAFNKKSSERNFKSITEIKKYISNILNKHSLNSDKYLVFRHNDFRIMGNDHSEVYKIPIFRCCYKCCNALRFLLRMRFRDCREVYISINTDNNEKLDKKIVIHKRRTLSESLDSDEMRINPEWLF